MNVLECSSLASMCPCFPPVSLSRNVVSCIRELPYHCYMFCPLLLAHGGRLKDFAFFFFWCRNDLKSSPLFSNSFIKWTHKAVCVQKEHICTSLLCIRWYRQRQKRWKLKNECAKRMTKMMWECGCFDCLVWLIPMLHVWLRVVGKKKTFS